MAKVLGSDTKTRLTIQMPRHFDCLIMCVLLTSRMSFSADSRSPTPASAADLRTNARAYRSIYLNPRSIYLNRFKPIRNIGSTNQVNVRRFDRIPSALLTKPQTQVHYTCWCCWPNHRRKCIIHAGAAGQTTDASAL